MSMECWRIEMLEKAPPATQLNAIIRQQLSLFLTAYPSRAPADPRCCMLVFLRAKMPFLLELLASKHAIPVKDLAEQIHIRSDQTRIWRSPQLAVNVFMNVTDR